MSYEIPYDDLMTAIWDADLDEDRALRPQYEGRGMYGREGCLGIVFDDLTQLANFIVFVAEMGFSQEIRSEVKQDGMGTSAIAYWPEVRVTDLPGNRDD